MSTGDKARCLLYKNTSRGRQRTQVARSAETIDVNRALRTRFRSSSKRRRRRATLSALAPRVHARTVRTLALLDTLGPPRTNSAIPSTHTHESRVHATYEAARSISRTACVVLRDIIPASRSYLQIRLQRQPRISTKCIDVSRQPFYYPHAPTVVHPREQEEPSRQRRATSITQ